MVRVGRDGLFGSGAALEKTVTIVMTVTASALLVQSLFLWDAGKGFMQVLI